VLSHLYHHGIAYTVNKVNIGLWKWAIFPPSSVTGYAQASGTVLGNRKNAIKAARREIEAQEGHDLNRKLLLDHTRPVGPVRIQAP
jgi:hypothetical protein